MNRHEDKIIEKSYRLQQLCIDILNLCSIPLPFLTETAIVTLSILQSDTCQYFLAVIGPSQKEDVVESEDAVSQSILQEASCEPVALQPNTDIIKSSAESTSNRFHLSLPEGSASLRPSGTLTPPISRKRRHEDSNNDQSDLLCKEPRIETSAELAKEGKTSTGTLL